MWLNPWFYQGFDAVEKELTEFGRGWVRGHFQPQNSKHSLHSNSNPEIFLIPYFQTLNPAFKLWISGLFVFKL